MQKIVVVIATGPTAVKLAPVVEELKNVCVISLGHIGLLTPSVLATHGSEVVETDVNLIVYCVFEVDG